jgi:hypothetical protein
MERLDLSKCKNSNEVKELIAERVSKTPLDKVKEYFSSRYYNIGSIIEFLYVSSVSSTNGILYGPGGFGKTDITKKFFEYFNIPVNTVVGYHDMDVEGLLGIPDMKKLMEDSEYVTAFSKSVFGKPGILLLEEFLDVRPSTAAALKDILTEGGLRQGDKLLPSLSGQTFICSNKDPEELSIDFSTAAFYKDRFPVNMFVAWDTYTARDYDKLFKIVFGDKYENNRDEFDVLAMLCSASSSESKCVSPRTAISSGYVLLKAGIESLKFISEIDTSMLEKVHKELKRKRALNNFAELRIETYNKLDEILSSDLSLDDKISLRFWLNHVLNNISYIKMDDDILEAVQPFKEKVEVSIAALDSHIFTPKEGSDYNKKLDYAKIQKCLNQFAQ